MDGNPSAADNTGATTEGNEAAQEGVRTSAIKQAQMGGAGGSGEAAEIIVRADPHMYKLVRGMTEYEWNWYFSQAGQRNDHSLAHMAYGVQNPGLAAVTSKFSSVPSVFTNPLLQSMRGFPLLPNPSERISGGFSIGNPRVAPDSTDLQMRLLPGFSGPAYGVADAMGASSNTKLAVVMAAGLADDLIVAAAGAPRRLGTAAERTVVAGETRAGTALQTYWPPNRGFQGTPITEELATGTRIDRYGYEGGTFLSPVGTPDWMRSLAPATTSKPYNVYEVVRPIEVQSGKAAPWFGQVGQGTQYELPMSVSDAIARGHLRRVGP